MDETLATMKCANCHGTGTIGISRLHPTDPTQDWWESINCSVCGGKGKDQTEQEYERKILEACQNGDTDIAMELGVGLRQYKEMYQ